MSAAYNTRSQNKKIESLNELLRSTNRSLATASLARLHDGPVGYAPKDLQLERLVQLDSMLEPYGSMELKNNETTSSEDSDDWKEAMKQAYQASREKSMAVDRAARITLNSLWPISGTSASEVKPAEIPTETQAIPDCLVEEIQRRKIPVHSLRVVHGGLASGWHAVMVYLPLPNEASGKDHATSLEAGTRQLMLASVMDRLATFSLWARFPLMHS